MISLKCLKKFWVNLNLEFTDERLEREFTKTNHKRAKDGIVVTAILFGFVVLGLLAFEFIFRVPSPLRVGYLLIGLFLLCNIAYSSPRLEIKVIRRIGYCLNYLLLLAGVTNTPNNPVNYVAFETAAVLLTGIFVIRSFKISKWLLTFMCFAEAIIFYYRYDHLDKRPLGEKMCYYWLLMLSWIFVPLFLAYHIEVELRNAFMWNQRLNSVIEQERLIFDRLSTGILLMKNGILEWKNPACDKIFDNQRLSLHSPIGTDWLPIDSNVQLRDWIRESCKTEDVRTRDFVYFDGNSDPNHSKHLHITTSWIQGEGEKKIVFLITDRTVEEDANRFKYKWLSTVSHEFRTPLNILCNMLDKLKDEAELSDSSHEFIRLGATSTRLLMIYVGDLVDYCLLRNNKFFIKCSEFSIREKVLECIEMLKIKANDKHIAIGSDFDLPEEFESIENDENRFQQVLINLLSNAIKFTPNFGKISVSVAKVPTKPELYVKVSDTGIGIAEQDQGKLFTEYGRIINDQTLSLNPQGVGLGLWICRRFCDQIGSGISVRSTKGRGSTFSFTLRHFTNDQSVGVGEGDNAAAIAHNIDLSRTLALTDKMIYFPSHPHSPHHNRNRSDLSDILLRFFSDQQKPELLRGDMDSLGVSMRSPELTYRIKRRPSVLIVDDEPVNRFILKSFCERLEVDVKYARDGAEGLTLIRQEIKKRNQQLTQYYEKGLENDFSFEGEEELTAALFDPSLLSPFDLIILDYQMPNMTGPELSLKLLAMEKEGLLSLPPIIGYTALISKSELDYFLQCGAIDILEKPTTFEKFQALVQKLI